MYFTALAPLLKRAVSTHVLLISLWGVLLTGYPPSSCQLDELIADDLIVGIHSQLVDIGQTRSAPDNGTPLVEKMVPVMERRPCSRSSRPAPMAGRPSSEKAVWLGRRRSAAGTVSAHSNVDGIARAPGRCSELPEWSCRAGDPARHSRVGHTGAADGLPPEPLLDDTCP